MLVSYLDEKKLDNAVNEKIEERTGSKDFTIQFIREMNYEKEHKENPISVGYTIEGDNTKYWGWYYWRDGDLVHDFTTEIEEGSE